MSVAPIRTLKRNGGGATISYYDGTTLLGIDIVPMGQDVLRPSITMPTKSGYTFVGWSTTTSANNYVTDLTANGEPMSLYALYVPNSLTIASGRIVWEGYGAMVSYVSDSWNTNYLSGANKAEASLWYREGSFSATATFNINKKYYGTATATVANGTRASSGGGMFDSNSIGKDGSTSKVIDNGTHTIETHGYGSSGTETWYISVTGVTSIVLSNPIEWT